MTLLFNISRYKNQAIGLFAMFAFFQIGFSQNLQGPTMVTPNSVQDYEYFDGSTHFKPSWAVTGGTIISSNSAGSLYMVTVQWGASGTGTVTFKNLGTLNVVIGTVPNTPTAPSVVNNCGNSVLTRGTPPSGEIWFWQSSPTGTSTSNSSSQITLTSGSVYYLRSRHNTSSFWSDARTVNYNIIPLPSTPTAPSVVNNCGNSVLTRGTPPSGETWYWQSSETGTSTANSASQITLTSGSVYYIRARNNSSGCWGAPRLVNYTVSMIPDPPITNISISNSCGETVISHSGSPISYETFYWQSSPTGTATGLPSSSTWVKLTSGTVYYLRSKDNNTGCWSNARAISYTVNTIPVLATGSNSFRCGTGTVTLSATVGSGGNTIRWYSASTGGTLLTTSTSYTTPSLSATTTYYAESFNSTTGCYASSRKAIQAVINPIPALATGSNVARCGPGTATLTAGIGTGGNTIRWYSAATGGMLLATSTSYTTPSLSATTTYYAESFNSTTGCYASSRKVIQAVINPIPDLATGSNSSRCGTGTVTLTAGIGTGGNTVRWYSAATGGTLLATSTSYTTPSLSSTTTYYAESFNSTTGCYATSRKAIQAVINTLPALATGSNVSRCGTGTVTLTAGVGSGGNTVRWYSAATGGTLLATSTSYTTPSLSATTTYYAESFNGTTGCAANSRKAIQAVINAMPIWYADADGDTYGNPMVSTSACSAPAGYVSNSSDYDDSTIYITNIAPQYFYGDADGDGFGDPNDSKYYSAKPAGYVSDNTDECPDEAGTYNGCDYTPVTFSDENHIYTRIFQEPMKSESEINQDSDIIESITYFDGLGRPMQSIAIKGAPDKKDIITHVEYDDYGRQDKDWLSYYESTGSLGSYRGDRSLATQQYYQANYSSDFVGVTNAQDIAAFSQKGFEESPLNRVLLQAAPGDAWKLGSGHEIGFEYMTNTALEVVKFKVTITTSVVDNISVFEPALVKDNTYSAGELYKTVTKDENWTSGASPAHTTEEFKDKKGRIVLKRTYGDSDTNMDGTILGTSEVNAPHDTYYVYDVYGNLTYVVPPKADVSDGVSSTELSELCYQYKYDDRNRLVEKKVPGKGWEYIVYNKLDQPVLTQDENQRPLKQWLFTKYDAFGRVAYTGLHTQPTVISRATMQGYAENTGTYTQFVTKTSTSSSLAGSNVYYTNDAIPMGISEIYTINYYDNYTFDGFTSFPASHNGQAIINYNNAAGTQKLTKGLATGSKVRVLGTSNWITTQTGYDAKGRAIYTKSVNSYLGTTDLVKNTLDFTGAVTKSETSHVKGGTNVITEDLFTYDHMGRLKKQTQELNNTNVLEVIAENTYDELGQLITRKVGGKTTQGRLQTVDYAYNIRGWLKQINNPATLGTDLFAFKLNYNTKELGSANTPLYNGNISETIWKTSNDVSSNKTRGYAYKYDALNRITNADYGIKTTGSYNLSSGFDVGVGSYDKNGNIISLWRDGITNNSKIDQLAYTYHSSGGSNKLKKVEDSSANVDGFKNGANLTEEYTYDANGNMVKDLNKGIVGADNTDGILYNHLNLPSEVKFGSTNKIKYIYDATGVKLEKQVTEGINTAKTFYAGNYVYKQDNQNTAVELQFFNHPEGYVDAVNGYKYVYQYKDHLGNIRLSYQDANQNNSNPVSLEILEENNYYPFGLKHKGYNFVINGTDHPYGYNGFEEQNELELGWIDYMARNYDPALGRWFNIDPLSEMSRRFSPYTYALNNPVYFIDPDGMLASPFGDFIDEDGKKIGSDGINDGKVYVVKTTETDFDSGVKGDGISKADAKATKKFIKANDGNTAAFQENSIAYDNSVEIEGSAKTRQSMVDIVEQDNGRGGTGDANNREYGGTISKDGTVSESPAGDVVNPKESSVATISHTTDKNTKGTFHSHPSGTIVEGNSTDSNTIQMSGTVYTYGFSNAPSSGSGLDVNKNNAGTTNYTFARKNGKVYIYNSKTGVQATLPHKNFVNFK